MAIWIALDRRAENDMPERVSRRSRSLSACEIAQNWFSVSAVMKRPASFLQSVKSTACSGWSSSHSRLPPTRRRSPRGRSSTRQPSREAAGAPTRAATRKSRESFRFNSRAPPRRVYVKCKPGGSTPACFVNVIRSFTAPRCSASRISSDAFYKLSGIKCNIYYMYTLPPRAIKSRIRAAASH